MMQVTISIRAPAKLARFRRVDHRLLADVDLVAACAKHDDQALGVLYDRHGKQAYALAYRVLRDAAFAEDAVQEAFLDVWARGRSTAAAPNTIPRTKSTTVCRHRQ